MKKIANGLVDKIYIVLITLEFRLKGWRRTYSNVNFARKAYRDPNFWYVLIIFLFGLIPLLWYSPGELALGHDMGFPLNPQEWFLDRIWTWSEKNNLGSDQSQIMASVILHGFEFLLFKLTGGSVAITQRISFIFWFMLPGMSMYSFIIQALKNRNPKELNYRLVGLFAAIIYTFNLFFLQAWFIAERNKFALLSALPLTLLVLIKVIRDKYSIYKGAVIISLIYLFLNGGGSLPLYGTNILITPIFLAILTAYYAKGKREKLRVFKFVMTTLLFFFLANAFWIVPQLFVIRTGFGAGIADAGGVDATAAWISEISKSASFSNLIRMQGFPDWSSSHHYAPNYLGNPLLVIVSYLFPILSIWGLFRTKTKEQRSLYLTALLALLVTIFFSAGAHQPFGSAYLWLVKNIPLFILFRTPFYKFAGGIVFAYAIMVSFSLVDGLHTLQRMQLKKNMSAVTRKTSDYLARSAIILILVLYTFPFLTGSFFDWNKPVSTMVKVPDYVAEYGEYIRKNNLEGRTLLVPDTGAGNSIDTNDWNYFGLDTVPSLVSRNPHVTSSTSSSYIGNSQETVQLLYQKLLSGDDQVDTHAFLQSVGIDKILLRKDSHDFRNVDVIDTKDWEESLNRNRFVTKEIEFGDWVLYTVKGDYQLVEVDPIANIIRAPLSQLDEINNIPSINSNDSASLLVESDDSYNKGAVSLLVEKGIYHREIIGLDYSGSEIYEGKIHFEFPAEHEQYGLIGKPLGISEQLYAVYLKKNGSEYILTIKRPDVKFELNNDELKAADRRQEIKIVPKKPIEFLVIGESTYRVPDALGPSSKLLGYLQTRSNQLSLGISSTSAFARSSRVISDPSFETSRWSGAQVCGGLLLPTHVQASLSQDKVDGNFALELSGRDGTTACVNQRLRALSTKKIYKLQFSYKNISGFPVRYCLLAISRDPTIPSENTDSCLVERTVASKNSWQTYSENFIAKKNYDYVLHFYSESEPGVTSVNLIDKIELLEVPITSIGAYQLNTGVEISQFFNIEENLFEGISSDVKLVPENNLNLSTDKGILNSFIEDSKFEKTLWGGANLCGGDSEQSLVQVGRSEDAIEGKYSLKLEAENGVACIYRPIQRFRPSVTYKLTFSYKNISGNAPQFCALVRSAGGSKCDPLIDLPDSDEWTEYSTVIKTGSDTEAVILHFYSPAMGGGKSVNQFDNLKMEMVYNPFSSLYFISDIGELDISENKVDFNIEKISPTEYILMMNNFDQGQLITLNTAFSPYWKLERSGNPIDETYSDLRDIISVFVTGELSSDDYGHVHANGLENSWLITEPGDYRISYLPQQIFHLGVGISIAYFVGILGVHFTRKANKKK